MRPPPVGGGYKNAPKRKKKVFMCFNEAPARGRGIPQKPSADTFIENWLQ